MAQCLQSQGLHDEQNMIQISTINQVDSTQIPKIMKVAFKPLKKKQWRALLEDHEPVTSDLGEFKAKLGDEIIRGFTKHGPNGKMKVFEDTNGNGRFDKNDPLIARGRVMKDFRGSDNPLDAFEVGKVKLGLKREITEFDPVGFGVTPSLDFTNSDGDMVAKLGFVQPSFPIWQDCLGCF